MNKRNQLILGLIAMVAIGVAVAVKHDSVSNAGVQQPVANSIGKPQPSWIDETFRWAAMQQEENRRGQALHPPKQAISTPTPTTSQPNQYQSTSTSSSL